VRWRRSGRAEPDLRHRFEPVSYTSPSKHPEWFREDLATLFASLAGGRIAPVVAEVLPLTNVREAHERVEAGDVKGKLVLRVTER
jgi:NADPH:quinone reductase-like Zn-dependent oxidoreductase